MKRLLLPAASLAVCLPAAQAQWFETFDSYAPASQAVGQGNWEEWGPGAGALVSNAQSRTPGNSVDINGATDLVRQYYGYNSGKWVYKAWQYIPSTMTGSSYFILLNRYAYPAGPYSWSAELQFIASTGRVSQNCGGPAVISMPFVTNQWAEIKVVLHLDADWVQIYYNGTLFDDPAVADHPTLGGGYRWSLGDFGTNTTGQVNLAAVDLYANNATSVYYDDISLTRLNTQYETFDAYATGSQAVGQGGWEEWGPGAGALVSNAQARSGTRSIDIVGATDLVHQYSGYNSGKWVYKAWQYIPSTMTGSSYFILLNRYAYPAGPYSWSAELQFTASTGRVSQNCGGPAVISMPFVTNQWAEIKVVLHLDADWVQIYYNGTLFDDPAVANHATLGGGYRWSLGDFGTNTTGQVNLAAVDLYANNATSVYYDDISLTPLLNFERSTDRVNALTGGSASFALDATTANANRLYIVLGTASGTSPGIPLPGAVLPINWDVLSEMTATQPNSALFTGSVQFLNANGQGTMSFNLPAFPQLVGLTFDFAYALLTPTFGDYASIAQGVKLVR